MADGFCWITCNVSDSFPKRSCAKVIWSIKLSKKSHSSLGIQQSKGLLLRTVSISYFYMQNSYHEDLISKWCDEIKSEYASVQCIGSNRDITEIEARTTAM